MPLYESVIICRQDITKNQLDVIISDFKKIIETLPDKIEEFERKLRLHEDIIRFMTIKIKTFDGKKSNMVETNENEN